jgi:hypothetical protein
MKLVGARKRSTTSADGRSIEEAKTIGGGSSIMGDLVSQLRDGGGITPFAPAARMHVPSGRATTGVRSGRSCAFVFDTRARVVNIGVQEKRKIFGAMEPRDLVN